MKREKDLKTMCTGILFRCLYLKHMIARLQVLMIDELCLSNVAAHES